MWLICRIPLVQPMQRYKAAAVAFHWSSNKTVAFYWSISESVSSHWSSAETVAFHWSIGSGYPGGAHPFVSSILILKATEKLSISGFPLVYRYNRHFSLV